MAFLEGASHKFSLCLLNMSACYWGAPRRVATTSVHGILYHHVRKFLTSLQEYVIKTVITVAGSNAVKGGCAVMTGANSEKLEHGANPALNKYCFKDGGEGMTQLVSDCNMSVRTSQSFRSLLFLRIASYDDARWRIPCERRPVLRASVQTV